MNHQFSNGHHGGLIKQEADGRDKEYAPTVAVNQAPPVYELPYIAQIPKMNQGQQGSCVGHGTAGVMMYDLAVRGVPIVVLSRSMAYYSARQLEGTTNQDSGAQVRDGVKGVAKWGICTNDEFPYNDQVFDVPPTTEDYAEAKGDIAIQYMAVHQPNLDAAIASGRPIVYGMNCYSSMMTEQVARTGIIPMPTDKDESEGGHCTWLFGYNSTSSPWTSPSGLVYPPHVKAGRNSWLESGTEDNSTQNEPGAVWWGDEGNYFLPQAMFDEGQCSDYWVVETTGVNQAA